MNSLSDPFVDEMPLLSSASSPRWSVRTFLIWLVLACLLPGVLGAGFLLVQEYQEGRAQLEKNTLQTARALVQAVDNQILRVQSLAQGLSTSDALTRGDLASFHQRARETLALAQMGAGVVLTDKSGQQIVSTLKEFGAPLPRHANPELVRRVFQTGQPAVSDLFTGNVLGRTIMTVAVPVFVRGEVTYVLNFPILPETFNAILNVQGLPAGWVASILDGTGTIVARTRAADEFVGKKAVPEFLQRYLASSEGTVESLSKEGVPVLSVYARSPITHWGIGIGIPREALTAELNRSLARLAMGIAALFAIGLGLAWLMGGRIARSVGALRTAAVRLGAGKSVPALPVHFREAAEVVTAIREAEELLGKRTAALQASNSVLMEKDRQLAEAHRLAKFGTWYWDLKTGAVSVSDSIREIYGREVPSFPEQRGTLLPVESWEKVNAAAQKLDQTGGYDMELSVNHGNGSVIWINTKCAAIRDGQGAIVALRGTVQDISEKKQAEQALRQSEEKYRTLFSNMTEGFALGELVYGQDGAPVDVRFIEANAAFYQQTGITVDIRGRPAREYLPKVEQSWLDHYHEVVATGRSARFENYNGDTGRHYDIFAFRPTPGRFAIIFRDITEIKRVEEALEQSEANLRELIATLPGIVWTTTAEGAIDFFSQRWYDYTGTDRASQLGMGGLECIHPEDRETVLQAWQAAIAERAGFHIEYRLRRHDGTYRWFKSRGTPVLEADNQVTRWLGVITDVHDLKEAQAALLDRERRYTALFNNQTSAIAHLRIVADGQGKPVNYYVEALNETYERIIGVKSEDVVGKLVTEAFPGIEDFEFDFIGQFGRIGLEGGEGAFEIYFPPTEQWLSVYAYSPKPGEVIAIFTDATAQKKAEMSLAHERELLSAIVENIPIMLCLYDPKLQRFRLNRHMERVLGWTTEDANAGDFMAKIFPDPEYRAAAAEYMAKLTPGWREFDDVAKDGSVIPTEWANVALSDESQVGIGIDLRESKQAQARLALHAERQELLLEVAAGILAAWANKAEMTAILFERVKEHLKADVCFNYRIIPDAGQMELVAGLGVPEEIQGELQCQGGSQAFCGQVAASGICLMADRQRIETDELGVFVRRLGVRAYMVHPLLGLDGRVIGTLSLGTRRRDRFEPEEMDFVQTIAYFLSLAWERRRAEQHIRQLNEDLERRVEERTAALMAANRELEGFTFATSHDLKGPLGRINSFSTLLEKHYRDRLDGDGLRFLDFIRQNATRLTTLVDDLLNHARVARDVMEPQAVDVPALAQAILREKAIEVQEAGAQVKLGLAPAKAIGDPHILSQALSNLVENALKYSDKAASPLIEIGGKKTGGCYRLWVRDNGIGFDMVYHDKIFEMFRRLHTYNEYQGTGVGLALVKRAMERMDGKVWAESSPGQGATFFLELPAA